MIRFELVRSREAEEESQELTLTLNNLEPNRKTLIPLLLITQIPTSSPEPSDVYRSW